MLPYNTHIQLEELTSFPFDYAPDGALNKDFPHVLGSSHPWPIAVLTETLSTSALKVLVWIIATTTKICTKRCSTKAHARGFATTPTPSYSLQPHSRYNGWVSVARWSAINFRGWFIRQRKHQVNCTRRKTRAETHIVQTACTNVIPKKGTWTSASFSKCRSALIRHKLVLQKKKYLLFCFFRSFFL